MSAFGLGEGGRATLNGRVVSRPSAAIAPAVDAVARNVHLLVVGACTATHGLVDRVETVDGRTVRVMLDPVWRVLERSGEAWSVAQNAALRSAAVFDVDSSASGVTFVAGHDKIGAWMRERGIGPLLPPAFALGECFTDGGPELIK